MANLLEFTANILRRSSSMSAYSIFLRYEVRERRCRCTHAWASQGDAQLASIDVVVFALLGTSLSMKMGCHFGLQFPDLRLCTEVILSHLCFGMNGTKA